MLRWERMKHEEMIPKSMYEAVAADLDKYHKLHDETYNFVRIMTSDNEAQQARIAELEKYNARLLAAVADEVLDELKALEEAAYDWS